MIACSPMARSMHLTVGAKHEGEEEKKVNDGANRDRLSPEVKTLFNRTRHMRQNNIILFQGHEPQISEPLKNQM